MKYIFILFFFISYISLGQINTFPYNQSFANTIPSDITTTSGGWNFTNNTNPRTGSYDARLSPAINGNNKYIYIKVGVSYDYTYTISLWSNKICTITINTNETADQTTLLSTSTTNINGCNGNGWKQSTLTYTSLYNGVMYFQILASSISEDKVYIDDITITEIPPVSLPIGLLYFNGKNIGECNEIEWSTASETNNDYFVIDRTLDGVYFNLVTEVDGAGNSTGKIIYKIYDSALGNNIKYYKLTQVDFDGKQTIYDMISIDNREKTKTLLRVTNILGQSVYTYETDVLLLFHYNDGSVIKKILVNK